MPRQIMHGLRSNGDMDFEDIIYVYPTLESAHDLGKVDLEAEQKFHPRMYKTHFHYDMCPKGEGKYIVLTRQDDLHDDVLRRMTDIFVQESKRCCHIHVPFLQWLAVGCCRVEPGDLHRMDRPEK